MTTINYNGLTLKLEATRYSDSGNLALVLTEESTGYLYETVTVDAPLTLLMVPDYDVILDTDNIPAELLQLVIGTGFIEEQSYGVARVGLSTYPIHNLTKKGYAWVDKQVANSWEQ